MSKTAGCAKRNSAINALARISAVPPGGYAKTGDKGIRKVIERINREIRRRTRVVGAFPDENSALMLVCARLRHVVSTAWGTKRYMSVKHLDVAESPESDSVAG